MASPIRWLHLSDFHVGKDHYAGRKMFDYIIAHVKQKKDEGFLPDFLFITGDLANKGLKSEYDEFWSKFVLPLQAVIGGEISERTFVVPGNHDVDRNIHRAFDRDEMLAATALHFDPTEKGLKERQIILPRFQAFADSDLTLTKGAFHSEAGAFAKMIEIRGVKVGIAGINTAWLCKDEHDERKLTPGKGMVEQALFAIKETQVRIVLGHHPIGWLQPTLHRPINNLFGQSSVIYLHGHLHEEWMETAYVGGRGYLAVQAGAAFQAREGEVWKNGLVWAEADLEAGEIKFQARRWTADQTWVPATEAFHENFRKGDWWHYPLPGIQSASKESPDQSQIVVEANDPRLKIMIGSTITDLPKHREQVIGAINRMGHAALISDRKAGAQHPDTLKAALEKVPSSHVYVAVFGQCYGDIPDDSNPERLSVTELEYRQAVKLGIPTLVFFAKESHPFAINQIDVDGEKRGKLERLKAELQATGVCGYFDSPEELREEVFVSLQRIQVQSGKPSDGLIQIGTGMPVPPELFAVPQYTLTGNFVGRSSELDRLDEWARSKDNIMVVEGIGGLGKSAVTWEWTINRAKAAIPKLKGCIWWSFYEHGTSLVTFVRFALAYITGRHPETLIEGWSHYQRGEQLLRELKRRPYLLVLDGFERVLAAYHQIDKAQIPDHKVEEHRCECINPPDGELLVQLLKCQPSKVLISTRLFPNDLLDRGSHRPAKGVARHNLNGLSPEDALDLVRQAGVTGDEAAILSFADQFGRHSLLLKVVCGLIADYRRRPLDFDAWHADPAAGGGLKLSDLELKQRRTHILHFALAGLTSPVRTLLCRIAIMTGWVNYGTLEILNPFQPPRPADQEKWKAHFRSKEYLEGLKRLDAALQELEDRGLLQWDRDLNRYDMHPIVRAHASEMLDSDDRTATFRTVHDHFASLPPDNFGEATELAHVARSLEIYRCLVGAGRYAEAARFLEGDLSTTLLFHIGAFATIVELQGPLFPDGFNKPPIVRGRSLSAGLLNTLAVGVSCVGRKEEAVSLTTRALRIALDLKNWSTVALHLGNVGTYLDDLDRRAEAAEANELSRRIGEAIDDQDRKTLCLLDDAQRAISQGRYSEGEAALARFQEQPLPSVHQYRPGCAEKLLCRSKFEQGMLTARLWQEGFDLAVQHRNVLSQYAFKALWAEAELTAGRAESALLAIDEALQIVNRIGTPKPEYHDLRAWALACLGRGAEAREELKKGKGRLFAAEAWLALGERRDGCECAVNGYRWAWGQGEPHVQHYYLDRCLNILLRLNEAVPDMPSLDPECRRQLPFETEISAELPQIIKPSASLWLITGKDNGLPAWYYLEVPNDKFAAYKNRDKTGKWKLTDHGTIIESGWGTAPPEDVVDRMHDESGRYLWIRD